MKCWTTALTLIVCLSAITAKPAEQYTDRYDGIKIEEVLNNRRLLIPYVKCLLDQGKCSSEGKELKSHIKEALESYCVKCTEHQRKGTRVVIAHLINNENGYWNELTAKYDPKKLYVNKYESELKTVKA